MTALRSAVAKFFFPLFWAVFAAAIGMHFWIGGVVIDHMIDDGQYLLLLREDQTNWVSVSALTYILHQGIRLMMISICGGAVIYALLRWTTSKPRPFV